MSIVASGGEVAKTVLITAASRGFGKDAALSFEDKGWNVAATLRPPEEAESWTRAADLFEPRRLLPLSGLH